MTATTQGASLTPGELIQAVELLDTSQLEAFTQDVLLLQAERRASRLSATETELLQKINNGVPSFSDKRYRELIAKRQADALTAAEHSELLHTTEQMEEYRVARVAALIELSNLRGVSLDNLMQQLGIRAQPYA